MGFPWNWFTSPPLSLQLLVLASRTCVQPTMPTNSFLFVLVLASQVHIISLLTILSVHSQDFDFGGGGWGVIWGAKDNGKRPGSPKGLWNKNKSWPCKILNLMLTETFLEKHPNGMTIKMSWIFEYDLIQKINKNQKAFVGTVILPPADLWLLFSFLRYCHPDFLQVWILWSLFVSHEQL